MRKRYVSLWALLLGACTTASTTKAPDTVASAAGDSAFKAMDHRHGAMMGVDPSALEHKFVATPDGGDVVLQRKAGDTTATRMIRAHLEQIARAFSTGDFTTPMMVHEKQADGADVMAAKAAVISYTVHDVADGAVLRIRTVDQEALKAIHAFIAFQNREHRTTS